MKQHITEEELWQLSPKAKQAWYEWCDRNGYGTLGTIGQMIEFLDEHNYDWSDCAFNIEDQGALTDAPLIERLTDIDLCDSLWKACREVLEK